MAFAYALQIPLSVTLGRTLNLNRFRASRHIPNTRCCPVWSMHTSLFYTLFNWHRYCKS